MAANVSGSADDLLGNRLEFETLIADLSASLLAPRHLDALAITHGLVEF